MVNEGHNYIGDVVDSDLKRLVDEKMLVATTDFSFVKDVDFIAICVPTPLDEHQQPDISYVKASTEAISKYLTKNTMVVFGIHHLSRDDRRTYSADFGRGFRVEVWGRLFILGFHQNVSILEILISIRRKTRLKW